MIVREKNDLIQWYKFFLVGIIETAKNGITTFDNILQLQKQTDMNIQELRTRAANAKKIVNYMYNKPLINAEKVSEVAEISLPSSYKLIEKLEEIKILKELTGGQRRRMYVFDEYLNLFR